MAVFSSVDTMMNQAVAPKPLSFAAEFEGLVVLTIPPEIAFSEDEFFRFCQANELMRIERSVAGEIILQPLPGFDISCRNTEVICQFANWSKVNAYGTACLWTGYVLPNGAMRASPVTWVRRARIAQLTAEQKQKFPPLCPDFALEWLSPTDRLAVVQAKMEEYIANGLQLGWLLDPDNRTVYVYRPNVPVEKLENVLEVSGDPELPGFVLQLAEIWEPQI